MIGDHLSIATANKLNSFQVKMNVENIVTMTETRAINYGTIDKSIQLNNPGSASIIVSEVMPEISRVKSVNRGYLEWRL